MACEHPLCSPAHDCEGQASLWWYDDAHPEICCRHCDVLSCTAWDVDEDIKQCPACRGEDVGGLGSFACPYCEMSVESDEGTRRLCGCSSFASGIENGHPDIAPWEQDWRGRLSDEAEARRRAPAWGQMANGREQQRTASRAATRLREVRDADL